LDSVTLAKYEARAGIIKALSHSTRLFIVDQLYQKQMSVNELQEKIGSDMSTVSKHLSILKNAGIVQCEKQGSKMIYTLHTPCVVKFFDCAEEVIRKVTEERYKLMKKD